MLKLDCFQFVLILVLEFQKKCDYKTLYSTFYSHSKSETIINESGVDGVFESTYSNIISITKEPPGQNSGWIIE